MDKIKGIIKAVSVKKKADGQIGFMLAEEDGKWYNVNGDPKILDNMIRDTLISKGNEIEFEVENGLTKNFVLKEKAKEKHDDDMLDLNALLDTAHKRKAKFSIKTEMLSVSFEKKRAVFKARVIVTNGEIVDGERAFQVFEGHGDADQENCGDMVKQHWIRMAETRAICRALRWYTNNAKAAEEEKH